MNDAINYKFNELVLIQQLQDYVNSTYSGHYGGRIQPMEVILQAGHGPGFVIGDIIKYAMRYGRKNGRDRSDLMKILHYALLALYVHDTAEDTIIRIPAQAFVDGPIWVPTKAVEEPTKATLAEVVERAQDVMAKQGSKRSPADEVELVSDDVRDAVISSVKRLLEDDPNAGKSATPEHGVIEQMIRSHRRIVKHAIDSGMSFRDKVTGDDLTIVDHDRMMDTGEVTVQLNSGQTKSYPITMLSGAVPPTPLWFDSSSANTDVLPHNENPV